MKGLSIFLILVVLVGSVLIMSARDEENPGQSVEHGKYIVHHVAMCVMCHTPRDEGGRLLESQLLEGGAIPVTSPYPNQHWALQAPAIKGLGGFTEDNIVHLLTSGQLLDGYQPQSPMPPFRMTEEDARAVVAYLNSLNDQAPEGQDPR